MLSNAKTFHIRDKVEKVAIHGKVVKNPPASSFFSNHIDFDFKRYSLISYGVWMFSNAKKTCFEFEKKSERKKTVLVAPHFVFGFFKFKTIYFFTFKYIQKLAQIKGVSTKMEIWKKCCLLANFSSFSNGWRILAPYLSTLNRSFAA